MPFDGRALSPQQQEILEAIDVLERAREMVRHRWLQGGWCFPARDGVWYCAAGALVAARHRREFTEQEPLRDAYIALYCARDPAVFAMAKVADGVRSLTTWNDLHTDNAPIVAGFDCAIADLSSQLERL